MISLAGLVRLGRPALEAKYGYRLSVDQRKVLNAIEHCRSGQFGEIRWQCSDQSCGHSHNTAKTCGHRSCPACQHGATSDWLERQQAKLLPVDYYMVTFTLPAELRGLAFTHQKIAYSALFAAADSTLKSFGETRLKANTGACAVLHTHSRRLEYHPHLHVVVPGGGVTRSRQWRKLKGKYLYSHKALAKVFRARLLQNLREAGLTNIPKATADWVVDCRRVGKGLPALQYLSRYLYKGVLSERNIIAHEHHKDPRQHTVTFQYTDSQSGQTACRTLPIADFLWLLLKHVLPTGFRRVRDYGLLHGNARQLRTLVQLILRVTLPPPPVRQTASMVCSCCSAPMRAVGFIRPRWEGR